MPTLVRTLRLRDLLFLFVGSVIGSRNYPWTPIVFLLAAATVVGNAIFLATRDPKEFRQVLAGLILLMLGIPAYFFWGWWNARNGSALCVQNRT